MKYMIKTAKRLDWKLLITILLLSTIGLTMVYSSSFVFAAIEFEDPYYFFNKQKTWLILSLFIFIVTIFIPYKLYGKLTPLFVLGSIGLLILVLIPGIGVERNYSHRWLSFGPILVQPSEICKLTMVLYFAHVYAKKQKYITKFVQGLLPPLVVLVVVFALILKQPDLGTATSIVIACGFVLICSGAKVRHIVLLAITAIACFAIFATSEEYRMERLTSYKDPFADPQGTGYQLINSYVAIAHGGVLGQGLGNSTQKFGYLPEAHTDFIMAIIAEELGLLGVTMVILLYVTLMIRGVLTSRRAVDPFGKLLAIGITFQLCSQAVFNLGAISGLLPITGITLPFISYGGSSLIITFVLTGILINISSTVKIEQPIKTEKTQKPSLVR